MRRCKTVLHKIITRMTQAAHPQGVLVEEQGQTYMADDRQALEQLCRYITRPALANERVQTNAAGQVVLKLKTAWRDGTTQLVLRRDTNSPVDCLCQPKGPSSARARPARLSPLAFMQRLAALVPCPRLHLIRLVSA